MSLTHLEFVIPNMYLKNEIKKTSKLKEYVDNFKTQNEFINEIMLK